MANAADIAGAIALCKSLYPNFNPDPLTTPEAWLLTLGDLDQETLRAATVAACVPGTGRAFAPSVDEIRTKATEMHARAAGIPDAYQAYEEVCKMPPDMLTRRVEQENGENVIIETPLHFSHALVETVARLLGWPKSFPTDNPGVDRGQFRQAYEAELARYMQDAGRLPMLTAYIDHKRGELTGGAPMLAGVVRQLEGGRE